MALLPAGHLTHHGHVGIHHARGQGAGHWAWAPPPASLCRGKAASGAVDKGSILPWLRVASGAGQGWSSLRGERGRLLGCPACVCGGCAQECQRDDFGGGLY